MFEHIEELTTKKDNIINKDKLNKELKKSTDLEDTYIKNSREIFRMHLENREKLKELYDRQDDEYLEDSNDLKIQNEIKEETEKKRKNIDDYCKVICKILMQMHHFQFHAILFFVEPSVQKNLPSASITPPRKK